MIPRWARSASPTAAGSGAACSVAGGRFGGGRERLSARTARRRWSRCFSGVAPEPVPLLTDPKDTFLLQQRPWVVGAGGVGPGEASGGSWNQRPGGSVQVAMNDIIPLPPMRTDGTIEISQGVHEGHPAYGELLAQAPRAGCCPVWISDYGVESIRTDLPPAAALAGLAERDAATVLAQRWPGRCFPWCDCRAPFAEEFPGLAAAAGPTADPIATAVRLADEPGRAHLALVPVLRPADVPAALGWSGMCNAWDDVVGLSAVLRSWEDRFGAFLVRIDRATLWLSVAAPPWTEDECLRVAAEHFAFCCDVDGEDPRPLRHYAETLSGARRWRFWWD